MTRLSLVASIGCLVLISACTSARRPPPGPDEPAQSIPAASAAAPGGPVSAAAAPETTAAAASVSYQAVICGLGQSGWSSVPLNGSGQQTQLTLGPITAPCTRFPTAVVAANNPPVAGIDTVSADNKYFALWSNPTGALNTGDSSSSSGQDAGYESAQQTTFGGFTDVSGADSSSFSQATVQDSNVAFAPATGLLWWNRNGHLFNTKVAGDTPHDQGPGYLYAFTPDGITPMPVPYYDSPSGKMRAFFTANGTLNYGPTSSLTPACLQAAGVTPASTNIAHVCDSTQSGALAAACVSNDADTSFAGWASDTELVCGQSGTGSLYLVSITNPSQHVNLLPATSRQISDALVTPDGKQVVFFAIGNDGIDLYRIALGPSGAVGPPLMINNWPGSASSSPAILGWIPSAGYRIP